jgi:multiple sugar transport system permease protein
MSDTAQTAAPRARPHQMVAARAARGPSQNLLGQAILLLLIGIFCVFPFYWMVTTSLKTQVVALSDPPLWRFTPTLANYREVLFEDGVGRSLVNSLIVAVCTTALAVGLGCPAAYALARFEFRGKRDLWFWFITNRFVSPVVLAFPVFLISRELGLRDTHLALILMYLTFTLPIVIWLCTDQFRSIPRELDEAAMLEGCSQARIFWSICLPLAMPGVVVSGDPELHLLLERAPLRLHPRPQRGEDGPCHGDHLHGGLRRALRQDHGDLHADRDSRPDLRPPGVASPRARAHDGRREVGQAMARALKLPMVDREERFMAQVAWAYYVERMTQEGVAQKLGTTRLRVNKALGEALRRGLVRITFDTAFSACAELEAALRERWGLSVAYVAPLPERPDDVQMVVGAALGHLLSELLADPGVRLFGMSWGGTLNLATRFVAAMQRPDLEVISVMGGLTQGSDVNSFEITTRLADLLGAGHSYFTAPLYAGSRDSRDIILNLDVFQELLAKLRSVDAWPWPPGTCRSARSSCATRCPRTCRSRTSWPRAGWATSWAGSWTPMAAPSRIPSTTG